MVAGGLSVDGRPVFQDRHDTDYSQAFAAAEPAWNGHLWVMVGPYVADIAIFRIAYSSDCPPELARHVHTVFGQDKGLYVNQWRRARQLGLAYEPRYVLSEEEVTRLMGGAFRLLKQNQAGVD